MPYEATEQLLAAIVQPTDDANFNVVGLLRRQDGGSA